MVKKTQETSGKSSLRLQTTWKSMGPRRSPGDSGEVQKSLGKFRSSEEARGISGTPTIHRTSKKIESASGQFRGLRGSPGDPGKSGKFWGSLEDSTKVQGTLGKFRGLRGSPEHCKNKSRGLRLSPENLEGIYGTPGKSRGL